LTTRMTISPMLISRASLDDLNTRLEHPVEMRRFRPNLVVDGCDAYAEDGWSEIRIGDIVMRVVKPCSRCPIPTVDPDTGEVSSGEPLQTLATYREKDGKIFFGQNVIHNGPGSLALDDTLTVVACRHDHTDSLPHNAPQPRRAHLSRRADHRRA
ncbi:MAG: hypothetical protein DSZ32_03135, partial [Gammaproteobacteria bacterium]